MKKIMRCGIALLVCTALILSSVSILANILPHEQYGQVYIDGEPATDGLTVSAWIIGVEYGSDDAFNGDGSYQIFTDGDDTSQTVCKYGGENGDLVTFWIDIDGDGIPDMIANENTVFESGGITSKDLTFDTTIQPSTAVKINELVPMPEGGVDPYIYIYDPVGITLADWRLENHKGFQVTLDNLTTVYHETETNMLAVDFGSNIMDSERDHLTLSWYPGTSGVNGNQWVHMDRVEYGYQNVKPDNTTLIDFPGGMGQGEGLKRVVNGSDTNDCSVDFSLGPATGFPGSSYPPSITMLQPNGGEEWKVGTNHEITWETTPGNGTITVVDLLYSTDDGSSWLEIATGIADNGVYEWEIPDDPSTACLVKGIVYDDQSMSGFDTSDETFDIIPPSDPSITIISPNGGESLEVGSKHDITWETTPGDGTITGIDLEYSADGGMNWTAIITGTDDNGAYKWTVPNESSNNCLIRGTVYDDQPAYGTDTSDDYFEIFDYPKPPTDIRIEHVGTSQVELVLNGNFSGGHSPWYLTRPSTDGVSQYNETESNTLDGSGSLNSLLEVEARNADSVEEGIWNQTIATTSEQLTVNGAYKAVIDNLGGNIDYNRVTIEIDLYDTGIGSWQNIYSTGELEETVDWSDFGPDAVYTPSGQVTEVRVRSLVEISTAGGGTVPTAQSYAWIDDISIQTSGIEGVDNRINWTASLDDGAGNDNVAHYRIYRSDMPNGPWDETTIMVDVTADGIETYSYTDQGKGKGDDVAWWYLIRAVDVDGRESTNSRAYREPSRVTFSLTADSIMNSDSRGWFFISFNVKPFETDLESILNDPINGINGSYDKVMLYDASTDHWKSYVPGRASHFNNIDEWDLTMGIWIHMTFDDELTIEGNAVSNTQTVLYPGWNMVSYPSNITGNNNLPPEVTKIGYFDASLEYNIAYDHEPTDFIFEPGKGYCIYNGADDPVTWTVEY